MSHEDDEQRIWRLGSEPSKTASVFVDLPVPMNSERSQPARQRITGTTGTTARASASRFGGRAPRGIRCRRGRRGRSVVVIVVVPRIICSDVDTKGEAGFTDAGVVAIALAFARAAAAQFLWGYDGVRVGRVGGGRRVGGGVRSVWYRRGIVREVAEIRVPAIRVIMGVLAVRRIRG